MAFSICDKFYNKLSDILTEKELINIGKRGKIYNISSAFDIETSSFYENGEKRATMYAWVFGINGKCIRGRYWHEFMWVISKVSEHYETNDKNRFIIYVHNLSYEFQWIRKLFKWKNVFSIDERKPLYALTDFGIEFRCSYMLSGYNLEKLGENLLKYKITKKVGDLDYSLIRHSTTPLNEKEWGYIISDCLVVMAHIQEEIERLGGINKIPLTKTGYVRNLCVENCLKGENKFEYSKIIKCLSLSVEDYLQLKRVYSGGFTHANKNYVGKTIKNVSSFDFTSSYPAVLCSEKFPMSKPKFITITSKEDFYKKLNTYCCMFDCIFKNIRAKVDYENYISYSRCRGVENYVLNNGRIVEASKIQCSLTEQDYFIIEQMYTWDSMSVGNFTIYYKDYLPREFLLTILQMYSDKTSLKGVNGKEVEYMVSKNMINALYGMCVTDVCRTEHIYETEWSKKEPNVEEMIENYNKSNQRTLYYPWGVWTTAYARRNLFTGILEFKNDYIYSDTDSIKVINIEKHKEYIDNYNKNTQQKISNCLKSRNININMAKPKTIDGIEKFLGLWEYEGTYENFKTLGAKRYITEKDGKISITISGVNKKNGVDYLKYKYVENQKIFDNFENNIVFPSSYYDKIEKSATGKLTHTYIDKETKGKVIDYLGNSNYYYEKSSVHMENAEYTLSLDKDFVNLILGISTSYLCKRG